MSLLLQFCLCAITGCIGFVAGLIVAHRNTMRALREQQS